MSKRRLAETEALVHCIFTYVLSDGPSVGLSHRGLDEVLSPHNLSTAGHFSQFSILPTQSLHLSDPLLNLKNDKNPTSR